MNKATAIAMLDALDALYPEARSMLRADNPFESLVCTMLSAQCTDARVNTVSEGLFAKYPDARSMSEAVACELEEIIKPCGIFKVRARSLTLASAALVKEHGGEVPPDRESLSRLAGVGRKTAGVVLMNAFGFDEIPVDTHVYRVSRRLGLSGAETPEGVEGDLVRLIPEGRRARTHHAMLWHGRRVCASRKPRCEACGLSRLCRFADANNRSEV